MPKTALALPLFVARVRANHANHTPPPNDFAVLAHPLDASPDFHDNYTLLTPKGQRALVYALTGSIDKPRNGKKMAAWDPFPLECESRPAKFGGVLCVACQLGALLLIKTHHSGGAVSTAGPWGVMAIVCSK